MNVVHNIPICRSLAFLLSVVCLFVDHSRVKSIDVVLLAIDKPFLATGPIGTSRHFLDDGICHSNLGNLETEMSDMEGPTPITRTYVGVYVCTHLYLYIYICVHVIPTYIYIYVCTCNTISQISDIPQLIYGLHIFRMGLIYRLMNGSGCLKHPRLKADAFLGTQASFAQRYIYIWKYLAKCITN